MVTKKKQATLAAVQKQITTLEESTTKARSYSALDLVGLTGDLFKKVSNGEDMVVEYGALALAVAKMLSIESITEVSRDATASVTTPWAKNVAPLVSILTRVHTVYLAVVEGRDETYRASLEKLWVALAARCGEVTTFSFELSIEAALDEEAKA